MAASIATGKRQSTSCAAVALSSVSAQQLDDSKMRALAMAYVYGAVTYLSEYDGILDESGRELAAGLLARHFVLDAKASRIVGEELSHAPQRDQRRFFMIEGASALRRQVAFGDDSPARKLGEMLTAWQARSD